ncbi:hypothetical protein [Flavobacterium luteum]|uniref:YfhO family protein n=1 Tax=Flavobacterium luteum TaxID=2026654 RepID=A0A7J5AJZ1_9FLAO|nr:hypothetical protein [Flavobacterium luteum]KAB1157896.1 hypothetical protein F6464_02080 [Flavobacterium luteum]
MIFILVQLNAYNLFNCLVIFSLVITLDIIGIQNLTNPRNYFKTQIRDALLNFLRNIENKKSFWFWFSFDSSNKEKNNNILIFILTVFIGTVTFASRYYFIIYDNYSLSDAWIYDLNKVIQFDNQYWFTYELATDAELAFVNFYGKITDVSPEIALQVISILESTLLAIIMFWVINKLTPSKILAPTIASLFFAMVYVLTPLNIYFLLKGNPMFLALTFALPAFVFYLKPTLLKITKITYFLSFVLVFIAVGLIDLFTLFILIPPFLIIGLIFTKQKYKRDNLIAFSSYLLAIGMLYAIYSFACYFQRTELLDYLQSNLLSVSSYTYVPQLILPYKLIIFYAQVSTFIGLLLVLLLVIFKKENWRSTFVFFLYFNFIIVLTFLKSEWIDIDMLYNSLSIFIPIIIGFNAAIIIRILNLIFQRFERFSPITVSIIAIVMIYYSIYYQKKNINLLTESDQTPKEILNAYDKIYQTFFQLKYSVVNDPATEVISTNKHFFINYDFFLEDYLKRDAIYFKNKKDPKFLVKYPKYTLTKSVLVFVLNDKSKAENNAFAENKNLNSLLEKKLDELKKRGRKINLFYKTDILKVYEIVNEPEESKISDLIF